MQALLNASGKLDDEAIDKLNTMNLQD